MYARPRPSKKLNPQVNPLRNLELSTTNPPLLLNFFLFLPLLPYIFHTADAFNFFTMGFTDFVSDAGVTRTLLLRLVNPMTPN